MTKENRKIIVDALYDRCSKGEISVDQREKLILKVNSMFTATESVETDVHESTDTPETEVETVVKKSESLTPKQKYTMFKESVYKKYTNGDISIDMREELLQKARDEFYPTV